MRKYGIGKRVKKTLDNSGLSWKVKCGSKHFHLYIEDNYVYSMSMGKTQSTQRLKDKVNKTIRKIKNENKIIR